MDKKYLKNSLNVNGKSENIKNINNLEISLDKENNDITIYSDENILFIKV